MIKKYTYLDKVQRGQHDMALLGWTGDNGDPDNFLYVLLDKSATQKPANNIAFYRSDPLHDVPWVPLVHATQTATFHIRVKGFKLHPTGSKWFHDVMVKE